MKVGDVAIIGVILLSIVYALVSYTQDTNHCSDCPSITCLCIQNNDGTWVLSPEVGDAEDDWLLGSIDSGVEVPKREETRQMKTSGYFYLGIVLFFVGQILGWFHMNAQFLSDWWKGKPLMSALILGVPTSILFWYAWRLTTEATQSVWAARFIGSSTGLVLFPVLTWYLLGESMFTVKTMTCLVLAILIILIQVFF